MNQIQQKRLQRDSLEEWKEFKISIKRFIDVWRWGDGMTDWELVDISDDKNEKITAYCW